MKFLILLILLLNTSIASANECKGLFAIDAMNEVELDEAIAELYSLNVKSYSDSKLEALIAQALFNRKLNEILKFESKETIQKKLKAIKPNSRQENEQVLIRQNSVKIEDEIGNDNKITLFLDRNGFNSLTEKNKDGATVLGLAYELKDVEIIKLLLLKKEVLDLKGVSGETVLMGASLNNERRLVSKLLSLGANPNVQNDLGATALSIAVLQGFTPLAELLLKHNADPNLGDKDGRTPLMEASSSKKHKTLVSKLLESGANINQQDNESRTALIIASTSGSKSAVDILLANKADVNLTDKYGETALTKASYEGYLEIIQELLKHKADLNVKDVYLQTALFRAVSTYNIPTIKLLLEHKADPNIRNNKSQTVLTIARESKYKAIEDILVKAGAVE